ncbi:MAG: tRNA (N6-threonylcarbamoyladenosine(37)-N6)-methyltransferase TrmO [Candidatus Hydrothermae bacterium]|nr:tRNA (N6-threonylcarbamoyladenosine(37)-N6)-methyltransferase TrmO [Candidatus Hydrothermae bacterium]RKZ03457.1 MAG: tRNA (N6-threonylcarbamoyladenosine(37)-N6)-methyltransferase TrmO [Candidatus Hydrothermae bacterium]
MELRTIGFIRSPFGKPEDAPSQGKRSKARGKVELLDPYAEGLKGLKPGQYIYLLYFCHRAERDALFSEKRGKGVFATRSPHRPNPIAIDLVRIIAITGSCLEVEGIDAVDGSPLLDIKPFVRDIDCA